MTKLKSLLTSQNTLDDDRILKKKFKTLNACEKVGELAFVKGKFSQVEISQVENALQDYLQERNIPREDVMSLIHSKKSKSNIKGFFREILEKSKYSEIPSNREKWSKEEDDQLLLLVKLNGFKWNQISQQLNRKDVKVRYEKISRNSQGYKRGKWSPEETLKFIQGKKALEEKYKIKNPAEFNHWTELSLIVKTRSFIQCRNKFIHSTYNLSSFGEYRIKWTLEDDSILLRRLKEFCSKAKDETEIIWNNIAFKEWQPWTGACLQRRWGKLKNRVPVSLSINNFKDMLKYISENIREISQTKYLNRDLLTLYSNQDSDSGQWTIEDSGELLSHISALFPNAHNEDDIDWDSLKFSNWDGEFLRNKWLQIKDKLSPNERLGLIDAVGFCKENLQQLSFEEEERNSMSSKEQENEGPSTDQSKQVAPKGVDKRKRENEDVQPTRKKKKKQIESVQFIHHSSSEGKAICKDKNSKQKQFKSDEVIYDSSSDGQSVLPVMKSKKKKNKLFQEVNDRLNESDKKSKSKKPKSTEKYKK